MPFNTGCYNVPNFLFFFLHNTVTCEVILSDAWSVWIKCKCLSLQSYSHTQGLLSLVLTVLIQSYDKSNAEIVMFPDREDAHQRHVHRFERREEAAGPSGGSHWQCPGGFLYTYINIRETFFFVVVVFIQIWHFKKVCCLNAWSSRFDFKEARSSRRNAHERFGSACSQIIVVQCFVLFLFPPFLLLLSESHASTSTCTMWCKHTG